MAGRVNTKFVVILVVSAVVVLGAGLYLFATMVNKTGESHAALARGHEANDKWRLAEESWGRAVGHEKTNIEWLRAWRDAIGQIVPETQTEYENFFARYVQISKQIAATLRTDPQVAAEYLELRSVFFRTLGGAARQQIAQYVNELDGILLNFPESSVKDQRDRLRRYRGFAWAALAGNASPLTTPEIDAAKGDLLAALTVDPGDGEAARALLELLDTEKQRATTAKHADRAAAIQAEKIDVIRTLLAADPEDPWGRISDMEMATDALAAMPQAEREASRADLLARLDELADWVREHVTEIDSTAIDRVGLLEAVLTRGSETSRLAGLYNRAIEVFGERTDLLLKLAALRMQSGDYQGAVDLVHKVESQPRLPVSVEGRMRLFFKMQAPKQIADFAVLQINQTDDASAAAALLDTAREARTRFAEQVGEESSSVAMLDGQIALARAELAVRTNDNRAANDAYLVALSHFSKFNELTEYANTDGLWREGRTAIILNKTGLARQRFEALRTLDPNSADVFLALAMVEEKLGTPTNLNEALLLIGQALDLRPGDPAVLARLERVRQLVGDSTSDDPIEAAVFEAERLATGADGQSPDAIAAERVVREALADHPGESGLIRQMVRVFVLSDRLDEARAFIKEMRAQYPDNEVIEMLERRVTAGSMLDIIILDIEESNNTELSKLLKKIEVYRRYGQPDKADETLARASALAPNDHDVLEQMFLQALVSGDMDESARIAARAEKANADKMDGITFQARLLAAQGKHAASVDLLREAVARISTEAPLWRLLATEQVALGRINEAVASFRRSLEIT
ncbi:MAG: hypothetical protein K8E66_03865, partial [Phycisphaerales bacterium]|nr:hypothetical protein [Phycisphaerales bacterium]